MIINKTKRITTQRIKILDYLKSVKTHPTAEMIYNSVKLSLPSVSLATVYRNLNNLADEGEILRLEINNEFHFDADKCCHQHCICKKCGKIIDIFQGDISEYALNKINSESFRADCVTIMFQGLCKNCGRGD